jgi:hypothetical protein
MIYPRASCYFAYPTHGANFCAICGRPCNNSCSCNDYIRPTFTDQDCLNYPESGYICQGCANSMGYCVQPLPMIDGTTKVDREGSGRPLQNRLFSWVFWGDNNKLAATKAHIRELREFCLNPPTNVPFAITLSDSGQKHQAIKTPVNMANCYQYLVRLEDENIPCVSEQLTMWLGITDRIAAVTGKPSLLEGVGVHGMGMLLHAGLSEEEIISWQHARNTPTGRLATWLTRPKDGWKNEIKEQLPWQ